jgi:curli biogenesis system outer membrane secretion channel CsgG
MKTIITVTIALLLGLTAPATPQQVEPQTPQQLSPAASGYSQKGKKKKKIAVMPFDGVNYETQLLAKLADEKTTSVFYASGRVTLVERMELDRILKEQKFSQSGLVEEKDAIEMGSLSGAKYVVTGKVTSTGYNTEWKTTTYKKKDGTTSYDTYQVENGSVSLQIKMIDVTNGEVIFSEAYNFSGSNSRTLKGRESLLANVLASGIGGNVSRTIMNTFPIEGSILFIDGKKSVTIDIGNEYGIKKGMRVEVISTAERTNATGRTVKITRTIAKLQVIEINGDETSVCKISDGRIEDLREGMSVILKSEKSMFAGMFGN